MRTSRFVMMALLVPALGVLVATAGCGGNKSEEGGGGGGGGGGNRAKKNAGAVHHEAFVPKEELASTGWGTLKGTVTYDGDPPKPPAPHMDKNQDVCLCQQAKDKGDTQEQTWKLSPGKGVANVVVWVRVPKNKYFKIPDDLKQRAQTVQLGQPYCAFEPHVLVLYPSYYDGKDKKQHPTGQKFEIINNATISHNTNYQPNDDFNPSGNPLLGAGKTQEVTVMPNRPNQTAGEPVISFKCNIHTWMSAYARVFDHPFVAVTKGDKEADREQAGSYAIAKVPAGAELEVVYWHEDLGEPQGIVKEKINLKDGETKTLDFKIKK